MGDTPWESRSLPGVLQNNKPSAGISALGFLFCNLLNYRSIDLPVGVTPTAGNSMGGRLRFELGERLPATPNSHEKAPVARFPRRGRCREYLDESRSE